MKRREISGVMSLTILAFALSPSLRSTAQPANDANFATLQADARKSFKDVVTPFVDTYCSRCHGQKRQKGGINFEPALKKPGETASSKRWRQALAKVRSHDMPPDSADKFPTDEERQKFLDGISKIKFLSSKDPGPFVIRRLTKVEYGNTLHDLLGVDAAVADELPDEVIGEGYLNTLSALQSEQYLAIANDVLDRVLSTNVARPTKMQKQLFGKTPSSVRSEER